MLYVISQMFNIFQSYSTTTLSHKTQSLLHVTASSNIPSCSCLPFFLSPRTANPFPFHHNYIQNIFKSSFFQLTRICLLYSIAFQHFLVKVILINNLVDQTTDKFTNLISIFKTHRKSSVMYLNILKSTAPGLTDFPLLLNHDLVYASLFYSPLFCSIKYLAIVSIPTLIR